MTPAMFRDQIEAADRPACLEGLVDEWPGAAAIITPLCYQYEAFRAMPVKLGLAVAAAPFLP